MIFYYLFFSILILSPFSHAKTKSRFRQLEMFNKVLHLVESQYYRNVDTEKLIQGAIKGMISTLDPHSSFLDEKVFKKMEEDTSGEFGGLGIEVTQKDGVLIVIAPIEDSPAFKAGIKVGDRIVEINGESVVGISLEESVTKMRGKAKSKISVGIARKGLNGIKKFNLKREIIKISSVDSKVIFDSYLYLRLKQFQKNSGKNMAKAIKKAAAKLSKKGGIKGIILDLRANPGGLLDEAVNVSSLFLRDGIVVSTERRDPKQKEIRYVVKMGVKDYKTPLAVLINGSSASASEIVAGALQDAKRAIIMGSRSFGKGSVQSIVKVDDNKGIKLTIAQYMTPLGRKIQAMGIVPDFEIDEVEGEWVDANKNEYQSIRESDLRNHLTATIESKEEKKLRLENEKKVRIARAERSENNKKKASKDNNDLLKKPAVNKDYQVILAVKYLKSLKFSQAIK